MFFRHRHDAWERVRMVEAPAASLELIARCCYTIRWELSRHSMTPHGNTKSRRSLKGLRLYSFLAMGVLILTIAACNNTAVTSGSIWTGSSAPSRASWAHLGNPNFSVSNTGDFTGAVAPNGTPYVAYHDWGGVQAGTVMKFDGTNWVGVGAPQFTFPGHPVSMPSLAFDANGTPYLAYVDTFAPPYLVNIWWFDGTSWQPQNMAGYLLTPAAYVSLAFDSNNMPCFAFQDIGSASVMQFDGSSWAYVGGPGFSAGGVGYASLAIDKTTSPNTLYVAYQDWADSSFVTVMKHDGTGWNLVGTQGFSAGGSATQISLKLSPSRTPYVAFVDSGYSNKVRVMRFAGGSWGDLGSPGISAGPSPSCSLAFGPSELPFVAFSDSSASNSVTLKQFTGTDWLPVGAPGFSASSASYLSLSVDSTGAPTVAYRDQTVFQANAMTYR
jgi:hypothetical protein